ncbi:DNA-binding response regulator, OmpR family, contains REC and winged-helix (wHTH) domain [Ruminococcaceae bacterium YRB3002]|nr:DNA-binding response regulator, OmpR family, contains REC and winged-helix (wHTH) domain [Ruminococcaceae bacterium YRB3002]
MSYRILIVEDTPELLEAICVFWHEQGAGLWEVVTSVDGDDAINKVMSEDFDLMILDIMLPGASGFDICRAARNKGDCPIIFLTALGAESEIMKGYETGCDDYVVKPFSIRHLYAKSLALLKRAKGRNGEDILSCGAVALNRHTMMVTVNGKETDIRSKEYYLLLFLQENKNAVLTRQRILDRVWGDNLDVNDRIVDITISRLRSELGDAGKQIRTVIGRGYKITEG